jgi:hypothetical protein
MAVVSFPFVFIKCALIKITLKDGIKAEKLYDEMSETGK